jgi:hypothetical protein
MYFRARRWCKFMKQLVDTARIPFWRHLYMSSWPTGPLYNLKIDTSAHVTDPSVGYPRKYNPPQASLDPMTRSLDSVQPPFDPSTFSWKLFCRHHCFNRLDFCPDGILRNPVIILKLGGLGAKFEAYKGPVHPFPDYRSLRAERPLQPLFAERKIGYYEVAVVLSEEDEEKLVCMGVCTSCALRPLQVLNANRHS